MKAHEERPQNFHSKSLLSEINPRSSNNESSYQNMMSAAARFLRDTHSLNQQFASLPCPQKSLKVKV